MDGKPSMSFKYKWLRQIKKQYCNIGSYAKYFTTFDVCPCIVAYA